MNTEQNYVGRGNSATKPTRTAQKEGQAIQIKDNWEQVVGQLKELLSGLDSTVILLVVDQSTTVISRSFNSSVKQIGSGNSHVSDSAGAKMKVNRKTYNVEQNGTLNALDSSDLCSTIRSTPHAGDHE